MAPIREPICQSTHIKDDSFYSWDPEDYGPETLIFNIKQDTIRNPSFRTTRWTGKHMQLTYMSIPVHHEIGIENHPNEDQFFCVISGVGLVLIGESPYNLSISSTVTIDCAVLIPSNTWHNLINTGKEPLKVYCIYSPVLHQPGTVHWTKRDSDYEK
ncbi:cupin domain-containing protein [Clostridium sp. E02]|uniref:cupin domain-containing protein n=1 Tax=Clostridium sp. E02 TaxID=2487134 RepID=UPI000F52F061|nr:cupin domain-containing protein [Clostridium sp. E02]